MGKEYHDKEVLNRLYNKEGLSGIDIAERFDVSTETIYTWMEKNGIERRSIDHTQFNDKETLEELYYEKDLSLNDIADKFDISTTPIRAAMENHGIEFKTFGEHQTPNQLKDKDWLYHQNHELGKTIKKIAEELGVSTNAVHNAFNRHGLENKYSNQIPDDAKSVLEDPDELERLYHGKGLSTIKIADKLSVNQSTVYNWLHNHGIETRSQSDITKGLHPRYNPEAKAHVYDKRWAKVRERVIERDGEECQECGISRQEHQEKHGMDLDVHHIVPQREIEDKYDTSNLTTMCRSCHITKEQEGE